MTIDTTFGRVGGPQIKHNPNIPKSYLYGLAWLILSLFLIFLASLDVYPATQMIWSGATILIMFGLRFILVHSSKAEFTPIRMLRLMFMLLAGMIALRYIWWRTFHTLPVDGDGLSLFISIMLYLAELQATVVYFLGMFVYVFPKKRDPTPLSLKHGSPPTVDVFIPTFNEPTALIKTTLLAATNLDYPSNKLNIYLLDDGGTTQKREQVDSEAAAQAQTRHTSLQQLCQDVGVHYLTRDKNNHAKAGNINDALKHTSGDLILILDCDHVPTVDFLQNTVAPFLEDAKLYLVQTAHFLINDDPIEKNTGKPAHMPSESEMFYTNTMRGLDTWNAAFFCGSGAVLRRKHLEEIGGICTQTVTEDIETSVELHSLGYNSIYYHKPMLAGLQPETFAGFMTQRLRWAHGMLQVFMLKNPLFKKGLNLGQRLGLFNMVSYWFFSYMRIMFLLAPVAYLLLDINLFDADPAEILLYVLPNIVAFLLYFDVVFGRQRWFLVSEIYETLQCLFSIRTVFSVLVNPKKGSFNVTPKDENIQEDFISPLSFPVYILVALVVIATLKGIASVIMDPTQLAQDGIVITWSIINTLIILGSLGALTEKKQVRHTTRFKVDISANIHDGDKVYQALITDLSATGMRMRTPDNATQFLKTCFTVDVYCTALKRHIHIPCKYIRHSIENDTGDTILQIQFAPQTLAQEREILALSYGDSERWRKVLVERNIKFGFTAGLIHFVQRVLPAGVRHLFQQTTRIFSILNFFKKRKSHV